MMRRTLVDAARTRLAAKRGGGFGRVNHSTAVNFDEIPDAGNRSADWISLDDALNALAHMNQRHARVIELRFFGDQIEHLSTHHAMHARSFGKRRHQLAAHLRILMRARINSNFEGKRQQCITGQDSGRPIPSKRRAEFPGRGL